MKITKEVKSKKKQKLDTKQSPTSKLFACLTEINHNEGETWQFFFPVQKNEDFIYTLREQIKKYGEETASEYSLEESNPDYTEDFIDKIIKNMNQRVCYMFPFNKIENINEKHKKTVEQIKSSDDLDALLYKGGLKAKVE